KRTVWVWKRRIIEKRPEPRSRGSMIGTAAACPAAVASVSGRLGARPRSTGEQTIDALHESLGVDRRPHLGIIVEIDKHVARRSFRNPLADPLGIARLPAARPGGNPLCPAVERGIVIAADIELFRAMQAAVDEIRRDIHQSRP